jgi:hypothetical protein
MSASHERAGPPSGVISRRPWNRVTLSKVFLEINERAGVAKHGGLHSFGRHSPATQLIKNGANPSHSGDREHNNILTACG